MDSAVQCSWRRCCSWSQTHHHLPASLQYPWPLLASRSLHFGRLSSWISYSGQSLCWWNSPRLLDWCPHWIYSTFSGPDSDSRMYWSSSPSRMVTCQQIANTPTTTVKISMALSTCWKYLEEISTHGSQKSSWMRCYSPKWEAHCLEKRQFLIPSGESNWVCVLCWIRVSSSSLHLHLRPIFHIHRSSKNCHTWWGPFSQCLVQVHCLPLGISAFWKLCDDSTRYKR